MFRIASVSASGTEVVEFDLVLEYGYLQFMGPRENDKRSMTANATLSALAGRWIGLRNVADL